MQFFRHTVFVSAGLKVTIVFVIVLGGRVSVVVSGGRVIVVVCGGSVSVVVAHACAAARAGSATARMMLWSCILDLFSAGSQRCDFWSQIAFVERRLLLEL